MQFQLHHGLPSNGRNPLNTERHSLRCSKGVPNYDEVRRGSIPSVPPGKKPIAIIPVMVKA
jgi:hypothetical protein